MICCRAAATFIEGSTTMARPNLSLPHERRKAQLKSTQLRLKVKQAETKEQLKRVNDEIKAMSPKPAPGSSAALLRQVR
jgi:hypothetical protein